MRIKMLQGRRERRKIMKAAAGGILGIALIVTLTIVGSRNEKEQQPAQEPQETVQMQEEEPVKEITTEEEEPAAQEQGSEEEEEKVTYPRIKKTKSGLTYTPYASSSKWAQITEDEKARLTETLIPVREDKNKTITRICTSKTNDKVEPYSYTLATFLKTYCEQNSIEATEGVFLAYAGWVSQDEEDIYIYLDDENETVLLARAIDQGRTWKFEKEEGTKKEVLKKAQQNEKATDKIPSQTAKEKSTKKESGK